MKYYFPVVLMFSTILAFGQDESVQRKKEFNLDNGVALSGYDPVSYFTQNKAVKGKKEFAVVSSGVTYYFATANDKEEFKKNSSKYEPQYGGWCAFAMGKEGSKVEIDPETFKIIDGKLYLFYNKFFNNTLKSWNKDEAKLHQQADVNWKKFYR